MAEICPRSDLPPSMCWHCRALSGAPLNLPAKPPPVRLAEYDSRCPDPDCRLVIMMGDAIKYHDELDAWVHETCP